MSDTSSTPKELRPIRESNVRIARRFEQAQASMEQWNPVICRACGAGVAIRINRSGFFQRTVLVHFGLYPWKCGACGCAFLCRRRSNRFSATSAAPSPESSG